jgi:hypothetical protein
MFLRASTVHDGHLTKVALGGAVIAALSLVVAFYTAWRSRRDRTLDQKAQDLRFRQMNEPVVMLKPQFSLAPGQNRLLLELTNLHGSIAVQELVARCRSRVEFDNKIEQQDASVTLASLKQGTTSSVEVGAFFCDFDNFVANLGRSGFEQQLAQVDVARAIQTLRDKGYIKNGRPPVGSLTVSWQYKPAQPGANLVTQEATYPLFIWRYDHGVFLSFAWPSLSGQ